jgi:hypothetical protein
MELNQQTATFTNLHGLVYENVQLERATHDGLIYTSTNTGVIGMVRYSDLPTNFLTSLKIPEALVTEAAQRQQALALEKQRYDAANRLLELQQETNNAARLAAAQATTQPAANQHTPSPPQAKEKPVRTEVKHHRRRR